MIDEYIKKWLIKANNDYKTAKSILNLQDEEIITDTLCFHCQQAAEKYLKAFLITHKIDFKKSHNLDYLIELCINIDKEFKKLIDVDDLIVYGVEGRYPDNFYIPSQEEAQIALNKAKKVKDFIYNKLHIKEEDLIIKNLNIDQNNTNKN